jgi:dipeptidyl aminopeptidase/acylaminoacyl peptidase
MGEVYRATDTNLGRQVAIKVLPDAVARDAERLTRFDREARALAALNHPNVAAIYGLEKGEGRPAIVMELVDGPTLADRIAAGPLGVEETIAIGVQIAGAVEAAHERGVVHRDLKPANIKVRPDGTVKVLDFGLARALSAGETRASDAATITMSSPTAGPGPGTPRYMSPEQARGEPVDHRADIWAIGCVLYEMLAGRPAFEGSGVSDILSRVLRTEPDWSRLPGTVSPAVRRLVGRCLEKNVKKRRQSAGDVRLDLEETLAEPDAAPISRARGSPWMHLAWIASAAVAVLLAIPAVEHLRERPQQQMRLQLVTPATPDPRHFALSPDGRSMAYVAIESDGVRRLHVRALDGADGRPLVGTEGARYPFWSPDSRSIGFFASDRLRRIAVAGGPVADLAPATNPLGGAWNSDGTILYAPGSTSPLWRVPDTGGMPREVAEFETGQVNHRWPTFLPDGRRFLFYAAGEPAASGLYLGSLDDGAITRLGPADDRVAVFVEPDHVVFVQQGALVARRLDGARAAVMGDLVTLVPAPDDIAAGIAGLSASSSGTLAYREGLLAGRRLAWFDRQGNGLGVFGDGNGVELSPDGRYAAMDRTIDDNRDVWRLDTARGDYTRLTTHPLVDGYPVWSPDGRQLVFETRRNGTFDLFIRSSSGGGEDEPLLVSASEHLIPLDWSSTGFLLYRRDDDNFTAGDLLALPMAGSERMPLPVAATPAEERTGAFSPDGRLVAYDTNEAGRFEVRVQAFPEPGNWVQVSTDGGEAPRWITDDELAFVASDGTMMTVRIDGRDGALEGQRPEALFPTRVGGTQTFNQQYDVSSDGRFLINGYQDDAIPSPITLLLNWRP